MEITICLFRRLYDILFIFHLTNLRTPLELDDPKSLKVDKEEPNMKKLLSIVLALAMLLTLTTVAASAETADEGTWKVAILTGTTSQGEEEFRAAEKALEKYGPEHIITDTYPDNFMSETETTISKLVAFASDPDVKAIVMCQAVPGATPGIQKIREMGRDDILFIAGTPQEDPAVISEAADIIMYANEAGQGDTIMEKCAEWGIDVFMHYSFPRHMAMETIVGRYNILKANAEALGIEFVDVTAPDPTGEAGTSGAQQFVLEDVPQQAAKYPDKKVAFFTTNCSMQPAMQAAILDLDNAYYPLPCCPSPYHGFPATLGLELELGDDEAALKAIAEKLAEHDAVDRFSTWPTPVAMSIIEIGVEYGKGWALGEITDRNNSEILMELFNASVPGAKIENYTNAEGTTLDNYYTILLSQVDFNDYL